MCEKCDLPRSVDIIISQLYNTEKGLLFVPHDCRGDHTRSKIDDSLLVNSQYYLVEDWWFSVLGVVPRLTIVLLILGGEKWHNQNEISCFLGLFFSQKEAIVLSQVLCSTGIFQTNNRRKILYRQRANLFWQWQIWLENGCSNTN